MKIKDIFLASAAASLALGAPVAAAAQTVEAGSRSTQSIDSEEEMGGSTVIVAIIAAIAVILGILAALDDDETVSP